MGRLQKRKPANLKKKKSDAGSSAPDSVQTDQSAAPATRDKAAETKLNRQKPAMSASRRMSSEQTALMKLVDRYFGKWIQFFREVMVELGKVTWPSRKETIATTAVVIVFVIIISLFLGAVDISLSSLVRLIL